MRTVTAEQLRDELDQHLALAASGETVVVEADDRGVVVEFRPAREVPPSADSDEAALAKLVAEGVMTPATAPKGTIPPHFELVGFEQLMRELDQDRADRW